MIGNASYCETLARLGSLKRLPIFVWPETEINWIQVKPCPVGKNWDVKKLYSTYRLPNKDDDTQQEVQRSVDGEEDLVRTNSVRGMVLDEVEQETVEQDGDGIYRTVRDVMKVLDV